MTKDFKFLDHLVLVSKILKKQKGKIGIKDLQKLTGFRYGYLHVILSYPVAEYTYNIHTTKEFGNRKFYYKKAKK